MSRLEELQIEKQENQEILAECIAEKDTKGISIQKRIIRIIEKEIEELLLPSSYELEAAGERYGYDYY